MYQRKLLYNKYQKYFMVFGYEKIFLRVKNVTQNVNEAQKKSIPQNTHSCHFLSNGFVMRRDTFLRFYIKNSAQSRSEYLIRKVEFNRLDPIFFG